MGCSGIISGVVSRTFAYANEFSDCSRFADCGTTQKSRFGRISANSSHSSFRLNLRGKNSMRNMCSISGEEQLQVHLVVKRDPIAWKRKNSRCKSLRDGKKKQRWAIRSFYLLYFRECSELFWGKRGSIAMFFCYLFIANESVKTWFLLPF